MPRLQSVTEKTNLTPQRQPGDAEAALRPKKLAGFVGQAAAKPSALPSMAKGLISGV